MNGFERILVRPLVTEKTTVLSERFGRYCFEVLLDSNKRQIREAVEKLYDVKVVGITTCITSSKSRRRGRYLTRIQPRKKAYVDLKDGQKIEFFKGV